MKSRLYGCSILLLVLCLSFRTSFAQTFTAIGSLPTPRWGHTATVLQNGTVLIVGGFESTSLTTPTISALIYNPSTKVFSTTGNLTTGRAWHTATLLQNGQVLIAGGEGSNASVLSSAELYDPTHGTFSAVGSMTTGRLWGATATLLNDGTVLIAGGNPGNGIGTNSANLYNPSSESFTATGNLIQGRMYHTATILPNGSVLFAGGQGESPALGSAEQYNPTSKTFSPVGNLITPRSLHTATMLSTGQILITGGASSGGDALSSAELYNPSSLAFSATGSLNTARYNQSATPLADGTVLIAGGITSPSSKNATSSAEVYNPYSGHQNFTAAPNMTTARENQTATLLNDGTVLITGGGNVNFDTGAVEIYSYPFTSGNLTPKYIVLGVLYSPPGAKSSVAYTQSTALGTSSTFKETFQYSTSIYASLGLSIPNATKTITGSLSGSSTNTWTQQADTTSTYTVNKTTTNAQIANGPLSSAIGIDHDYDQVLVWVNPKVNLAVGNNAPSNILWGGYTYDSTDTYSPLGPDVVPVYVFCLKNPFSNPVCTDNSGRLSRNWDTSSGLGGLTLADYAEIAQRDPFYSNPSYNPNNDPNNRYTYTGQAANYNPAAPGDGADTYSGSFAYSAIASSGQDASDSYQVSYTLDAGIKSILSAEIKDTNTTTWTNMWSTTQTTTVGQNAAYSITTPLATDNYQGPTNFEVWQDNIYGTFMFYAPGSTPTSAGSIGVSLGTVDLGSVVVGSISSPVQLTLTNNSSMPMFMGVSSAFPFTSSSTALSPVAAFSDPRFSVGTDSCTGLILPAGGSCAISVKFSPPASDAPTADTTIDATVYFSGETDAAVLATSTLTAVEEPVSPLRIGYLGPDGTYWVKEGGLSAGWVEEAYPATQVVMSGDRLGYLDTNGVYWVKEGGLSAGWVEEAHSATQIVMNGNRLGYLDTNGVFWVNEGSLNAGWVEEAYPATQIAMSGNRLGYLDPNGIFWEKEGPLANIWNTEISGAVQIALSGDRIGYLDTNGTSWVKEGDWNALWSVERAGSAKLVLTSDSLDDEFDRIASLDKDGTFWIKQGSLATPWMGEAQGVQQIALSGDLIGYLDTAGIYWVKQGDWNAMWTQETSGVAQIVLSSGTQ